jgi:hypothetical protein
VFSPKGESSALIASAISTVVTSSFFGLGTDQDSGERTWGLVSLIATGDDSEAAPPTRLHVAAPTPVLPDRPSPTRNWRRVGGRFIVAFNLRARARRRGSYYGSKAAIEDLARRVVRDRIDLAILAAEVRAYSGSTTAARRAVCAQDVGAHRDAPRCRQRRAGLTDTGTGRAYPQRARDGIGPSRARCDVDAVTAGRRSWRHPTPRC